MKLPLTYKRRYRLKLGIKATLILAVPVIAFVLVVGWVFPPDSSWGYFFWALGIIASWFGFLAGLAELLGSSLPQWIGWDLLRVDSAFDKTTRRTLWSIRDTLPVLDRRLERAEIRQVWDLLAKRRPTLIVGESGSGKSGIAAGVVRKAQELGIPVLFLDTRSYSSAVTSFGALERYVGVKVPLRDCLEGVAVSIGKCLLVVDQLDSAVGTPALQVSTELLAQAASSGQVYVVAVSCMLDCAEYQPIAALQFETVHSSPIPREALVDILGTLGVYHPSDALLTLSDNLFNLSLVAQVSEQGKADESTREVMLLELLAKELSKGEGTEFTEAAAALARDNLRAGHADFALKKDQRAAAQRLENRAIIVPTSGGRYRFRHEQLLYYFFARSVIEEDVEPATILTRLTGLRAETALVWVVRLYRHRRSRHLPAFMEGALQEKSGLDFYEKASVLDEVITWEDIADQPGAVDAVTKGLVADGSLERYFFRHLAESGNVGWFEPLRGRGFFNAAPAPIRDGNSVAYPFWPALGYLEAVAPKAPEAVVEVANKLSARDPFMLLDLVRVAKAMPAALAAQMVPAIVRWAGEGMRIEASTVDLARFLAQAGQWEAALVLVGLVLMPEEERASDEARQSAFNIPGATAKAGERVLRAFVERDLAYFVEHRPIDVLRIIQRNLESALGIEAREGGDASRGWRPAIEPHEQNWGGEVKDLLVEAAVQALSMVAENRPAEARALLDEYLGHRFSIFVRLAIHSIRLRHELWPDLLERLFLEAVYLENPDVHHEYWWLMHDTCGLINTEVREDFIGRLLGRLPPEEMRGNQGYDGLRYRVLKQVWAIYPDWLSDKQQGAVRELVAAYGPPDYPDFLSYSYGSGGWVSPKSPSDLDQLSAEETIAELRRELPLGGFDGPSQEGLANALKQAVSAHPEKFALVAPALIADDIPPIYTHYAVWGFHEAWKADRPFAWEAVLSLCELVSHTVPSTVTGTEPLDLNPGYWDGTYAGARSAVADMLHGAVARDDRAIPSALLGRVRGILLALSDDPNPSSEYERRYGSGYPHGWLDVSLNVTRAKAVEALLQYALHFARLHEEAREEAASSARLRWEPEVRAKVAERLDVQVDPSLAVHSLFGRYLPNLHYLDQEWLLLHLEDVFPPRPELADYWEAAWEGYLFQGNLYHSLFGALRPCYRYALEQLALGPKGKAGSDFARGRLARHVSFLYWYGVETLEEGSLVRLFFDVAPDDLRAAFVQGIENSLRELAPDAGAPEWQRAKALWQWRLVVAKRTLEGGGGVAHCAQEIGAYVGWVPHIPVSELRDMYAMIEVGTMASDEWKTMEALEFLSSQLPEHIGFVASLLEKLVERVQRPWFLATKEGTVHKILECAMSSGNSEARASAARVINTLGQRGDERYRSLLKEANRASLEGGVV